MFAWIINRAAKNRRFLKTQTQCERCNSYYNKYLKKCPHCSDLKGYKVKASLNKRYKERKYIGKLMFLAAAAILIIMFIFK